MSRTLNLSDEEYAQLERAARQQGSTIAELVRAWIDSMSPAQADQGISDVQARWENLGEAVVAPTEEELRAHPLLRAAGIVHSGAPGWSDRHDELIAEEALDSHADE
jgi:hypothetical protein